MSPDQLSKSADMLRLLAGDIQSMINIKSKGEDKVASRKSLEPTVRLRSGADELTEVKNTDPEVQFIIDKLRDVFGG